MAICLIHQNQLDSLCPCSDNYKKGKALAEILQLKNISLKSFWLYLSSYYEMSDYIVEDKVEFCSGHVLVARELESKGLWEKLFHLIEEFKTNQEQNPVFYFKKNRQWRFSYLFFFCLECLWLKTTVAYS